MKKLITFICLIFSLSVIAQTDSIVYHAPVNGATDAVIAFRIDTAIIWGTDTVTSDSNYVWLYYHYVETTGDSFLYQPQFVIYDDHNNRLLPNVDLMGFGWRASGTVFEVYIDSAKAAQTADSLINLLVLPELQSVYGTSNVTRE